MALVRTIAETVRRKEVLRDRCCTVGCDAPIVLIWDGLVGEWRFGHGREVLMLALPRERDEVGRRFEAWLDELQGPLVAGAEALLPPDASLT